MKTITLVAILVTLLLLSCNEKVESLQMSGRFTAYSDNSKVYLIDSRSKEILDSTIIKEETFELRSYLESPSSLQLKVVDLENNQEYVTWMFLGNEKVKVSGSECDFLESIVITGSEHQNLKDRFDRLVKSLEDERGQHLQKMFVLRNKKKWTDSLQDAYWGESGLISRVDIQYSEITKKFIENNINTYFGIFKLSENKNDFSKEFIQSQLHRLDDIFKKATLAKGLQTYLATAPLRESDCFYDFEAQDENGKLVYFADHFSDSRKNVLLEFYSAYCGWCIQSLPKIKTLADNNSSNLRVVTLNVDSNNMTWRKQHNDHNIKRSMLWLEAGRNSEAYIKYHIAGTPTYYLFDNTGSLIKKWTGFDDEILAEMNQNLRNSTNYTENQEELTLINAR